MLEKLVAELFERLGHTWILSNNKIIVPTDSDIEKVFDEAAKQLHNGEIGDRLNVGRMIIEKQKENNHDVYLYIGTYK